MIRDITIVAVACSLVSPEEPQCPKICDPSTVVSITAGSGWTATIGSTLAPGKGEVDCTTCTPCRTGVFWSFTSWEPADYKWASDTDFGSGSTFLGEVDDATIRVQSGCDEIDVDVFRGYYWNGSGWATGALVQLYCTCPVE